MKIAFAMLVVAAVIIFGFVFSVRDIVQLELYLASALRFVGGVIAILAAFVLLVHSWNGAPMDRLPGALVAFLAGILLSGSHWTVALALGAIGLGLTVPLWKGRNTDRQPDTQFRA